MNLFIRFFVKAAPLGMMFVGMSIGTLFLVLVVLLSFPIQLID
jgi:hypothetical protein